MNVQNLKNALCFIFLLHQFVYGSDLVVRPGDKELLESPPRSALTTFIRIENQSAQRREMVATVSLPQGWKLITEELPFIMAPRSTEARMLSFFVPANARAGQYRVEYKVTVRKTPEISDYAEVYVQVLPSRRSSLEITTFPGYVIAGTSFQVSGEITNSSNVRGEFHLSASSSENYSLTIVPKSMILEPGESGHFTVEVESDETISKSLRHHLSITARMKNNDQIARDDCFVTIIPKTPSGASRYFRYPVVVTGRRVIQQNGERHTGFQGEIFGDGQLFENSLSRLQFRFRGPDIYSRSFLADHDEYFVSYKSPRFNLLAGDGNYHLSDLTERIRYGRGIEVDFRSQNLTAGAYYQHTRWLIPKERQSAAYLRYGPQNRGFIGLNFLNKYRRQTSSNVVSLEGVFKSAKNSAELEYAVDDHKAGGQKSYRANLNGSMSFLRYNLYYISADPEFSGYYRDTRYLSGTLSARLSRNLSITGIARQEQQNFDIDSTKYSAPISQYYQAGLNYRFWHSFIVSADYLKTSRKDRLPISKFDYREESLRFTLASSTTRFTVNVSGETGRTYNRLLDRQFGMNRITASARYNPTRYASVRTFLYYDDNQRYSGEKRRRITAGASIFLAWRQRTEFHLEFQNNYSPEDYYFDRNLFELRLKHRLPFGHQISLTGRHTLLRNSLDDKETAVLFEYSVPLNIPVSKKRSSATVIGRVIDGTTQMPMENVFLSLDGSITLTRENGEFVFPPVAPGRHNLTIDRMSIGINRVTIPALPLIITLLPGEERVIEIRVEDGAKISGKVFYRPKNELEFSDSSSITFPAQIGAKPAHLRGINDLPVFISNGEYTASCFTENGGLFSFEGLQPGQWSIRIDVDRLPPDVVRNFKEVELTVDAGANKKVEIELAPKARVVNLVPVKEKELVTQPLVGDDRRLTELFSQFIRNLKNKPVPEIDRGLLLGMSYMRLGRYETALQEFRSVIQHSDSKAMVGDAIFMAAECYEKTGKKNTARALLHKMLDDYKESSLTEPARKKLGVPGNFHTVLPKDRYFLRGQAAFKSDMRKALPNFVKSVTIQRNSTSRDAALWFTAECLYNLKMWDEARAAYREIRSADKLPAAFLRLGQIASQKGETDLAKYHFGRTILLAPGSDYAARAESAMNRLYAGYLNSPIP